MQEELLLINATVHTMDQQDTLAEAVLICGGRIAATGGNEEVRALAAPGARVIDLAGRSVFPGFIDTHVHLMQTGVNMLAVDLSSASSLGEVLELLREKALSLPEGVLVRGIHLDETTLAERRLPHRAELDKVSAKHPVFLARVDCHSSVVNTAAFWVLQVNAQTPGVDMGPAGEPSGILREQAHGLARAAVSRLIPAAEKSEGLRLAAKKAVSRGITTVHALEGGILFDDADLGDVSEFAAVSPVRIVPYFQTMNVEKAVAAGVRRIGGCIPLDGSIGSHTAALAAPYADNPGTSGALYHSDADMERFVAQAHAAHMQVSLHAIGERAIDQALGCFAHAARLYPGYPFLHRIEHFIMATDEHIHRAAELGLIITIQPVDHYIWGRREALLGQRLGDRLARANRYRTWASAGLLLAGGSDSDVTEFAPMLGMYGAMFHQNEEERLDLKEALRLYTVNAAVAGLEIAEKGTVERDKLADLTILSGPLQNGEDFKKLQVEATLVGGRVVFGDLGRFRGEEKV